MTKVQLILTGCILLFFLGDSLLSAQRFELIVENIAVVKNGLCSFLEALMMASYYVFNMQYPADVSASLDFVQRYLQFGSYLKKADLGVISGYAGLLKLLSCVEQNLAKRRFL